MSFTESEDQIWAIALKNTEATTKKVARVYLSASREIAKELETFFKIADPSWSKQYQAERLKRIFEELTVKLELITGMERQVIQEAFLKQYYDTYFAYSYAYSEYATGASLLMPNQFLLLPFSIPIESAVMAALNEKVGEYSFLKSTRAMQDYLRADLQSAVAIAIQKGESVAMLTKRLNKIFDSGLMRYATTARTEMLKAYSISQEESAQEAADLGIEMTYIWKASGDGRTRTGHRLADGQVAKMHGDKPVFEVQVWRRKKGQAPILMGTCKGPAPRLMTGAYQAECNINCRCRRVTMPFKYDPDVKPEIVNGVPDIKEYVKMLSQ